MKKSPKKSDDNTEPKNPIHRRVEMATSVVATGISLVALLVAWTQFWNDRDFKLRMERPQMMVGFNYRQDGSGFIMKNGGVGPAFVKWINVTLDGDRQSSWESLVRRLGVDPPTNSFRFINPGEEAWLPQRTEDIFWAHPGIVDELIRKHYTRVQVEVCFCTLFDKCEVRAFANNANRKMRSCSPAPTPRFGSGEPILTRSP